jgi:ParB-like chromosome segregation protein Spo0J
MTNAPSITTMMRTGQLKRADALKAKLEDLHVEPGFNWRDEGADLEQSINQLAAFIADGGQIPDLEVRPRADGGVYIVDGHRRHRALLQLAAAGHPLPDFADKTGQVWVPVKAFTGSEAERMARVMTSQEGRPLTPVEIAKGYLRMHKQLGLLPDAIAKLVHKTRQHVDQMLILAKAGADVHALVAAGDVSATMAVEVARKNGDQAAELLKQAADKAKAAGKKKATAASAKPWAPKKALVADLVDTLDYVHSAVGLQVRTKLIQLEKAGKLENGKVEVPAGALWELLEQIGKLNASRAEHEERQMDDGQADIEDQAAA